MKDAVCGQLQGVQEKQKVRYLGLPLVIGKANREMFNYVTDAVAKKVASWKNNFLSATGKEVLLKSIISAMSVYAMSYLKLPGCVGKEVETKSSLFWRGLEGG